MLKAKRLRLIRNAARRLGSVFTLVALTINASFCCITPAQATDYNREIIYQIFTDRFFSGRTDNDDPNQSPGLFDESHKNWKAYWGGDLAGIKAKLDYIQGLGATAIWISPVIDNINKPINDASGKMASPYHGYHARDFMRIEEHFGDPANTFADFDALTEAAHKRGIKVFVDMPFNHTSPYNHGEYGALFNSGQYRSDVENDKNKYFNHLPAVTDFNNRFQLQYHTIFFLGDLNQENSYIDTYLKLAAQKLRNHGADGTRLDAAKHANWAWEQTLANQFYGQGDHLVMGEWWLSGTSDPLYRDAVKFANKGGISLFDFNLAFAIRDAFKSGAGGDFSKLAQTIAEEDKDFACSRSLLTFIDNHDMSRFLSLNSNKRALSLALALLFTCRGIPIVYYGTEQYLHDDTNGGEDPYDRPWMSSFDQSSEGYKLVQKLSKLRQNNCAFTLGDQAMLHVSSDAYVFARQAGDQVAVVAINKNPDKPCKLEHLKMPLTDGTYSDQLQAGLNQSQDALMTVKDGFTSYEVPPASIAVWCQEQERKAAHTGVEEPWIGSVRPPVVSAGTVVTIYGHGFGQDAGKLKVGAEVLGTSSWSDDTIKFTAPQRSLGQLALAVERAPAASSQDETGQSSTGQDSTSHDISSKDTTSQSPTGQSANSKNKTSKSASLTVVETRLIPVRFVADSLPQLAPGDQIFITGSAVSLGQGKTTWQDAAGPMIYSDDDRKYILTVPMPAGKSVDVKLIVLDQLGKMIKQESAPHSYKVPAEGCWKHDLVWQK